MCRRRMELNTASYFADPKEISRYKGVFPSDPSSASRYKGVFPSDPRLPRVGREAGQGTNNREAAWS